MTIFPVEHCNSTIGYITCNQDIDPDVMQELIEQFTYRLKKDNKPTDIETVIENLPDEWYDYDRLTFNYYPNSGYIEF